MVVILQIIILCLYKPLHQLSDCLFSQALPLLMFAHTLGGEPPCSACHVKSVI